ncbi:MAG: hypothetical protein Q7V20_10490 [Aquabacterium sp.]|nr:hypothetical protein [Aquabacterium sp.]
MEDPGWKEDVIAENLTNAKQVTGESTLEPLNRMTVHHSMVSVGKATHHHECHKRQRRLGKPQRRHVKNGGLQTMR